MQFNRYRFSTRSQNHYGQLKHKTGLGVNVLARFGLCLSLKDPSIPNPDEYDEKGMEIMPSILFGEHENIYRALMVDRLQKEDLTTEELFHRMTRAHLNRGAAAMHTREQNLSDFYDMIQQERK